MTSFITMLHGDIKVAYSLTSTRSCVSGVQGGCPSEMTSCWRSLRCRAISSAFSFDMRSSNSLSLWHYNTMQYNTIQWAYDIITRARSAGGPNLRREQSLAGKMARRGSNQSINQAFIAGSMAHKNTHKTKKKGTHTHAQLQTTNLYKKGN